ncbi:ComF family protein [Nitrosovibrio tenuis]|uniref:ComF family protein n=1 Tax=Nitrosovibrio tenuis TaxID=1233 RepID=A0A1H7QJ14_9PROT|nr:ComF family protein [Nitrosovibrio tenuis]SEL48101.1 comF family protein [Nitrosovibrio tenuis]
MQSWFRKKCLLCEATSDGDFCRPCRDSLPHLPTDICMVCALPVKGSQVCGACLAHPPAFDRSIAAFEYAFPVDALLQGLKYRANLAMARVLADLLIARIGPVELPECVVPMPLHPVRLRERGFNQALEIARHVSKNTGVMLLPDVCQRIRDTPSQTVLPWKERERNIRGAFTCEADLEGKHIAVLDDVMTTGATLNELAKVLRRRGAARVSGWVVARTLPGALPSAS